MAGYFYPDDPVALRTAVRSYLAAGESTAAASTSGEVPRAVIAPHAGYIYSGPVAGRAWATLAPARGEVKTVVLLGPAHRVPVRGLAVVAADAMATPLGPVAVDDAGRAAAVAAGPVAVDDAPHAPEHSLEVHLPFLVETLGPDVTVVPLVAGRADDDAVADVIEALWDCEDAVVVVSTDLSHYHDDATARRLDQETADAVVDGRVDGVPNDRACGAVPLRGLMVAAARRGLPIRLLHLATSADTVGPPDRVVGYGAFTVG